MCGVHNVSVQVQKIKNKGTHRPTYLVSCVRVCVRTEPGKREGSRRGYISTGTCSAHIQTVEIRDLQREDQWHEGRDRQVTASGRYATTKGSFFSQLVRTFQVCSEPRRHVSSRQTVPTTVQKCVVQGSNCRASRRTCAVRVSEGGREGQGGGHEHRISKKKYFENSSVSSNSMDRRQTHSKT